MDLNPDSAAFYAKKEIARRNSLQAEGALKTGCVDLDTNVLLGGFERGTIVGVSAEDEEGAGILVSRVRYWYFYQYLPLCPSVCLFQKHPTTN